MVAHGQWLGFRCQPNVLYIYSIICIIWWHLNWQRNYYFIHLLYWLLICLIINAFKVRDVVMQGWANILFPIPISILRKKVVYLVCEAQKMECEYLRYKTAVCFRSMVTVHFENFCVSWMPHLFFCHIPILLSCTH